MIFLHEHAISRLIAGDCRSDEPGVFCAGIEFTLAESIAFGGKGFGVFVKLKSLLLSSLKIELK